jgi:hypothetical protein
MRRGADVCAGACAWASKAGLLEEARLSSVAPNLRTPRRYRTQNPLVSSEFRLAGSVRLIAQAPQRWAEYLHGKRRLVIQRFPFSVVYLDDPELVTIIAIALWIS